MNRKKSFLLLLLIFLGAVSGGFTASAQELFSPNGKIKIEFSPDNLLEDRNAPAYQVFYEGKQFLLPSRLGFELAGQPILTTQFETTDTKRREHRSSWAPVYGEKEEYPDNYNELAVTVQEQIPPHRVIRMVFRAYDEGIAFRYEFPDQESMEVITILDEQTTFAFPEGTYVWEEHGHEGLYKKVPAGEIQPDTELPLTVQTANGIFGAIAEAGNSNYPRAYVESTSSRRSNNTIKIALRGEAKGEGDYATAWRTITLGDQPGDLMEQNYLILNLNEPNQIEDTSWIKPGTTIRDVTLSTKGSKKYIDYAHEQGIDYVILDWGWYGVPFSETADPSTVNVVNPGTGEPITNHPGLNIEEVVEYAESKGVGIWLYINRQGLERYADKAFPVYQEWGIKGIKPGFVNVGKQEWQQWMEEIVKKAAEHQLMVNIHDAYRPTGFSRTYPNLLSQEGVHGNEQSPDAVHNTTLPFTRYTTGAGDYTPGYCRSSLQNSWAHRLALPVIYYSPAQFLFWGEPLSECHNRPELVFWEDIPVTWDDTKVLDGAIGQYITVARRKGKDWYVASITNNRERILPLKLNFLQSGKAYEATIYIDDPKNPDQVSIQKKKVNAKTVLSFPLKPSGGFALQLKEK